MLTCPAAPSFGRQRLALLLAMALTNPAPSFGRQRLALLLAMALAILFASPTYYTSFY
jgi:hypothetical protein